MNRLDWLKAIRRGLSANAVIAIGAFTTYLFSDGVVSAAAIAVLLLDAMSAAVFLLSSYLGKTAAEMALVMTVLSVIVLSTAGAYLVSYLFSNLPESVPSAVETEADPPAYFEESESPVDTMEGNQSPSPDDLPLVIAENDEEDGDQDESPVKEEIQDESEPSSAETEAEDSVPAPEEIIIGQEPIIEEPAAEETDAESVVEAVIDEPVYAEEPSEPVVTEEPVEEAPVSTVAEAVIEEEPEAVIAEPVPAEVPEEESSEPVVTEEPAEETPISTASEESIDEDATASETSEFAADDFFAGLSEDEAAFWADFYIAGQDEFAIEDGIYYIDLTINDTYVGTIETEVISGKANISRTEFDSYIRGSVIDELADAINAYDGRYIPLDYIKDMGVDTSFVPESYEIFVNFNASDMPVKILSIRGNSSRPGVFRPIAGGINLDPAVFVLRTKWGLSGYVNTFRSFDKDSLRFTFTSNNTGRLFDVNFNFSYYMDFTFSTFGFRMGSYRFYKDFEEEMIRLSWGNVTTDNLSPKGRAFGIRFEKDYSYGGSNVKRRSHVEKMLLVEKESEVIIYNEGREIFRRTLDPGSYRLEDFVLYTGANQIVIRVEPLDGSAPSEQVLDVMYSSSLLAPGEVLFGGALVSGRETSYTKSNASDVLSIPVGSRYIEYDWKNVVLSGYVKAGLTDSLTMNATLAFQNYPTDERAFNPRVKLNTEFTHANILGTTRYNLNIGEYMNEYGGFGWPRVYARIGQQVTTGWTPISSVNLSLTYSNPEENMRAGRHRYSLSTSLSGRYSIFSWSTSFTGTLYSDMLDQFSYSWSVTGSFSFSRNFWLTASMTLNGSGVEDLPNVSGRVYATVRFGGGSVSASSSFRDMNVSANYRTGAHSFSADISTNEFTALDSYAFSASYDYSGHWLDFSFDGGSNLAFNDGNASFSLSTTTVFADGMFALGADIPNNFLLIRQYDSLKGNELTYGAAGYSATSPMDSSFGTSIFSDLSSSRGTTFSLYSSNENSFSGTSTFDVNVPPSDLYGYVLRLHAESKYAVTGVVMLPNGNPWINGSSPLYRYSVSETGEIVLEQTEIYVFTDIQGRFIISDLEPGTYAFDVNFGKEWMLAIFEAQDLPDNASDIQVLVQSDSFEIGGSLPEIYSDSIGFDFNTVMTGTEFWNMVYPDMGDAV